MKIACLAWGSLVWKPGVLPVCGPWHEDGPCFPIELCRVGDGGELATAICLNAPSRPALWALLDSASLEHACEALREREQIPLIARWAQAKEVDAVIWTALPPRFAGIEARVPSVDNVIGYLTGLTGEVREHAREYIERLPQQIDTPYREAIENSLGWKRQI
ncbi:hypothetical protein AO269_22665 [Pseudomonas putida]|nr:hypothetical protein AO269_22665 [Pseudomonas putida]